MQRRFKISVDGREYDVTVVEISDGAQGLYPEPQLLEPGPVQPEASLPAPAPSARPEAGPGDVVSPISGVVASVDVAVGAQVSKGMQVVTLEAMKTKTIVSAGRSGTVSAVAVGVGDAVEAGQPLLTIDDVKRDPETGGDMESLNLLDVFQGLSTLWASEPRIIFMRLFLIGLGMLLIYLGHKGVLEGLLMIPMGLGMATVNAGVLFLDDGRHGNLFVDPLITDVDKLMGVLQVNWLQPVYTLTFSNGLIACLVFMGIGALLDVGYMMARPFQSMFIALCAELGTVVVFPLAHLLGFSLADSAAIATIGGADGPMILFTSLVLSKDLFVPITVVAYLYLGLTYGGYPYMIKLLVPRHIRGLAMPAEQVRQVTPAAKITFCVVSCTVLCLLFPVAAPLFLSLFVGVIARESGLTKYAELFSGPLLYGATFFLGLLLGVLCEANTLLNREVLILLVLGIVALTISGLGGLLGGYVLYFASGRKFNPVIGIAGVSCLPTTAKVAQKCVAEVTPDAVVLPHALGASISGVITSAVFAGIFIALVQ